MSDDFDLTVDLSKLPWPDGSVSGFYRGPLNPPVGFIQSADGWDRYADGYRRAGAGVYQSYCSARDDRLIFPMVFLYSHYCELRLKELLRSAGRLIPVEWQVQHNIMCAWVRLKPLLQKVFPEEPSHTVERAEQLLVELAKLDPLVTCRYPEGKDGQIFSLNPEHIDVANFVASMDQLSAFLDAASTAISVRLDS